MFLCSVMKLLLRNGASVSEKNAEGQTALDIAKEKDHQLCCDLLEQGADKKSALFENVNIDWDLDLWKVSASGSRTASEYCYSFSYREVKAQISLAMVVLQNIMYEI